MSAIFNKVKAACGCYAPIKSPDGETFTQADYQKRPLGVNCCYTVDLGSVYDQMVVYTEENTPCEQCVKRGQFALSIDCESDPETGECISCTATYTDGGYPALASTSPHGRVSSVEVPQCAKLVILKGVVVSGSSLSYEDISIFKSRKRGTNPYFFFNNNANPKRMNCDGSRNPRCDPDAERKCCYSTGPAPAFSTYSRAYFEYRNCTVSSSIPWSIGMDWDELCLNCTDPNYPPVLPEWFSNFVLPCGMDETYTEQFWLPGGTLKYREYMFGYRPEASWWFVNDELPSLYADLAQSNPYGSAKHNIAIHFEVTSKSISCCNMTCPGRPEPGTISCPDPETGFNIPDCEYGNNSKPGFCGDLDPYPGRHNKRYITDKDARERATKIYAVAGFYKGCGKDDLQGICDKHYESA